MRNYEHVQPSYIYDIEFRGRKLRYFYHNDRVYFVLKDISLALGYCSDSSYNISILIDLEYLVTIPRDSGNRVPLRCASLKGLQQYINSYAKSKSIRAAKEELRDFLAHDFGIVREVPPVKPRQSVIKFEAEKPAKKPGFLARLMSFFTRKEVN